MGEVRRRIDYIYEHLGHALGALDRENGFAEEVRARVRRGKKLLFKPNLVGPRVIDPVTHAVNLTNWSAPQVAALAGTLTSPAGFPGPPVQVDQLFGNNSRMLGEAAASTVTATIPLIAAGTASVFATTSTGGATTPQLTTNWIA